MAGHAHVDDETYASNADVPMDAHHPAERNDHRGDTVDLELPQLDEGGTKAGSTQRSAWLIGTPLRRPNRFGTGGLGPVPLGQQVAYTLDEG